MFNVKCQVMKKVLILVFISAVFTAYGQPNKGSIPKVSGVRVTYVSESNKLPFFEVVTHEKISIARPLDEAMPFDSVSINYATREIESVSVAESGDTAWARKSFQYPNYKIKKRDVIVCGWKCALYKVRIKSDTIEIWATDNVGFNGTPAPQYGIVDGLVLRVARNKEIIFDADYVQRLID